MLCAHAPPTMPLRLERPRIATAATTATTIAATTTTTKN
jgi:hypothetical protein